MDLVVLGHQFHHVVQLGQYFLRVQWDLQDHDYLRVLEDPFLQMGPWGH